MTSEEMLAHDITMLKDMIAYENGKRAAKRMLFEAADKKSEDLIRQYEEELKRLEDGK